MSLNGLCFQNYDFDHLARHGWATVEPNGHCANFDDDLYEMGERRARETLIRELGIRAELLPPVKRHHWRRLLKVLRR